MEQETYRLYPSALLENNDLEQRLEKKFNDFNIFNKHINKIKKIITYFKDKNKKSKQKYNKYNALNTVLEPVDSIVINGATSFSITLSTTGVGWNIQPISAGIACNLSLGNKVLHKIIVNKYNKFKKLFEKDLQTKKISKNYTENLYKKM